MKLILKSLEMKMYHRPEPSKFAVREISKSKILYKIVHFSSRAPYVPCSFAKKGKQQVAISPTLNPNVRKARQKETISIPREIFAQKLDERNKLIRKRCLRLSTVNSGRTRSPIASITGRHTTTPVAITEHTVEEEEEISGKEILETHLEDYKIMKENRQDMLNQEEFLKINQEYMAKNTEQDENDFMTIPEEDSFSVETRKASECSALIEKHVKFFAADSEQSENINTNVNEFERFDSVSPQQDEVPTKFGVFTTNNIHVQIFDENGDLKQKKDLQGNYLSCFTCL